MPASESGEDFASKVSRLRKEESGRKEGGRREGGLVEAGSVTCRCPWKGKQAPSRSPGRPSAGQRRQTRMSEALNPGLSLELGVQASVAARH